MEQNMGQMRNVYLEQKILSASPDQLILYMYDAAVKGCKQKSRKRASRALIELINALNFEEREMAQQFFRLYRYCLDRVNMGKFDQAEEIISGLREAWYEKINQY